MNENLPAATATTLFVTLTGLWRRSFRAVAELAIIVYNPCPQGPVRRIKSECSAPAATLLHCWATLSGVWASVYVPLPNWPNSYNPCPQGPVRRNKKRMFRHPLPPLTTLLATLSGVWASVYVAVA